MPYNVGDKLNNGESIIRRVRKEHIIKGTSIHREAFRPRIINKETKELESGVSCQVEDLLTIPISQDKWSTAEKNRRGACKLDAAIPNELNYHVIYDADPTQDHCSIKETVKLNADESALAKIAEAAKLVFNPWATV